MDQQNEKEAALIAASEIKDNYSRISIINNKSNLTLYNPSLMKNKSTQSSVNKNVSHLIFKINYLN